MYLEHDCTFTHGTAAAANDDVGLVEHYGHSLIKECEIEIGGQKIDKHTSMWNRVYSDLTQFNPSGFFGPDAHASAAKAGKGTLYQLMTGNHRGFNTAVATDNNEFGIETTGDNINGFIYLQN